jgi:hypothetical protein
MFWFSVFGWSFAILCFIYVAAMIILWQLDAKKMMLWFSIVLATFLGLLTIALWVTWIRDIVRQ